MNDLYLLFIVFSQTFNVNSQINRHLTLPVNRQKFTYHFFFFTKTTQNTH